MFEGPDADPIRGSALLAEISFSWIFRGRNNRFRNFLGSFMQNIIIMRSDLTILFKFIIYISLQFIVVLCLFFLIIIFFVIQYR